MPDGTDRSTVGSAKLGDYLPCDATAEVSMCCALGREEDVDICLPGGICRHTRTGNHYRESCTDKSWNSSVCVRLFVDGTGKWCLFAEDHSLESMLTLIITGISGDVDLSPCDNGSWCLGANDTGRQCCQQKRGLFILDGETTTDSPNVTSDGISAGKSAGPMSTGAYVGIGLGVGLGVIAVAVSVVIILLRRRGRADQDIGMPGSTLKSLQDNSEYGNSPVPPNAMMPTVHDQRAGSAELDTRISTNVPNWHSELSYRASGLQDEPAELPCEDHLLRHDRSDLA